MLTMTLAHGFSRNAPDDILSHSDIVTMLYDKQKLEPVV